MNGSHVSAHSFNRFEYFSAVFALVGSSFLKVSLLVLTERVTLGEDLSAVACQNVLQSVNPERLRNVS